MRNFLKKNWFRLSIVIFLIFDCVVLFNKYLDSRRKKTSCLPIQVNAQFLQRQMEASDFYNQPCPEITVISFDDKKINLYDLMRNVIIIRFSKFLKSELPDLIFMEHLAEKYKAYGISLIFINSSERHNERAISKLSYFDYPIMEDDGLISGYFNATPEDTIIVDRSFSIKFKYHLFNKTLILNEVKKWTFGESVPAEDISNEELESILRRLTYRNVLSNRVSHLLNSNIRKREIVTLFTSMSLRCRENKRIYLLEEVASQINAEKTKIILLFGRGNNANTIRDFAVAKGWDKLPMTIGVIEEFSNFHKKDYYNLFDLAIDPRTFILNETGKILFIESPINSKLVNKDFLRRK